MKKQIFIGTMFALLIHALPAHAVIGNGIRWLIANGLPVCGGISHIAALRIMKKADRMEEEGTYVPDHSSAAPQAVTEYVKNTLKDIFPDSDNVHVHVSEDHPHWRYSTDSGAGKKRNVCIGLNQDTKKTDLELLLQKDPSLYTQEEQLKLAGIDAVLGHEGRHSFNHDIERQAFADLLTPIATWTGLRTAQTHMPWLRAFKNSSAVGLGLLNIALLQAYARKREQEADYGAVGYDERRIRGMITFFNNVKDKKIQERPTIGEFLEYEIKHSFPEEELKKAKHKWTIQGIRALDYIFLHDHPRVETRIARLEKRLEAIKKA
jgi:hypothetical protein